MRNLLICYVIVKVRYRKLLLIHEFIIIDIQFEILGKKNYTYDDLSNTRKKIRPGLHISKPAYIKLFNLFKNHNWYNEVYRYRNKPNMGLTNNYHDLKYTLYVKK